MPYRISFASSNITWEIFEYIFDAIFFIDVGINFFSAFYDIEENLIVDKKVYFNFLCNYIFK